MMSDPVIAHHGLNELTIAYALATDAARVATPDRP